ncbi:4a-hydroxytetrahydrobiopterin dehydratase [Streptomyces sp. H27-D2]|uniref:4a-hydroxytetrahydrobiopterin dehydratase n=1 Tax=Streptomyces sp. H27-D2 TaxID=3046304 RepID=UPI002DBDF0C4|nr:4a-hydroxytetrahydrobiopterin dehydratase [Streptomyces sp. H27-D2]MEC4015071.1 4a-hydroxytetrahydrobiopterin dehydratase [Streptomyces sp. H27-D2]
MSTTPLNDADLTKALADLPGWTVKDGDLNASFKAARADLPGLYAAVAAAEDDANHHAGITILYGTVSFALNTHDADGAITEKDTALAARISALATEHRARPAD